MLRINLFLYLNVTKLKIFSNFKFIKKVYIFLINPLFYSLIFSIYYLKQ